MVRSPTGLPNATSRVSSPAPPRSLPRQPSVRRSLLTRSPAWAALSSVTPSPWTAPFGSPSRRPTGGRSRGFCSSPVPEYRGVAVVAECARDAQLPIVYLREARQGKSFALNRGLAYADSDVVAL